VSGGSLGLLLRHLLAVAMLPAMVAGLIPYWLARRNGISLHVGDALPAIALQALGLVLLGIGVVLFVASLRRFAVDGRGTLAPWDPPRHLVVRGPYRYVRNPMITGVAFVLAGEALLLQSRPHAEWALLFLAINAIYIPLVEEPLLAQRHGEAYRRYCAHVPRLLPRLRPWTPENQL
jgi:protein-S-isoprenylcysteine O-methyltransferase Ste14